MQEIENILRWGRISPDAVVLTRKHYCVTTVVKNTNLFTHRATENTEVNFYFLTRAVFLPCHIIKANPAASSAAPV